MLSTYSLVGQKLHESYHHAFAKTNTYISLVLFICFVSFPGPFPPPLTTSALLYILFLLKLMGCLLKIDAVFLNCASSGTNAVGHETYLLCFSQPRRLACRSLFHKGIDMATTSITLQNASSFVSTHFANTFSLYTLAWFLLRRENIPFMNAVLLKGGF